MFMKKIIPTEGKVILSHDKCIRVGKHVIGWWSKEHVAGSSHYRPSQYEGRVYYTAKLTNDDFLDAWTMADLRDAIIESGKDGIEPEED